MLIGTHAGYEIHRLTTPADCADCRGEFIGAYQTVFGDPPYNERYTTAEAEGQFRRLTETQDHITLIARKEGKLAGFAIAVPLASQPAVARELPGLVPVPHAYYLAELGVLEDHRGSGLGRHLVRTRIKQMDTERYSHVVLRVSAARNASYDMYMSMDFDDMGVYMEVSVRRTDGQVRSDRRLFLSRMISQVPL